MKLHVLHVFNTYLPKSEQWAFNQLVATTKIKHFILAEQYKNLDPFESNFKILQRQPGLDRTLFHQKKSGFFSKIISKFQKKPKYPQLIDAISKSNCHIIHFHFGTTLNKYFEELMHQVFKPIVVSCYGYDYGVIFDNNGYFKKDYKNILPKISAFICEGPYSQSRIHKAGVKSSKIHTISPGIIPFIKKKPKKIKDPSEILRLVQIASFTEKKGQINTIEACKYLTKKAFKIELTLIGDSRQKDYYKHCYQLVNGCSNITIKPWVPYNDLVFELQKYDFFIQPSCFANDGDSEGGSPTMCLIAMNAGIPIISTNHCDIPYQLPEELQKFIAIENNLEDLIMKITAASALNFTEYNHLCNICHQHVVKHFHQKNLSQKLTKLYFNLSRNT